MPSVRFLVLGFVVPVVSALVVWFLLSDDWREHADLVIGILSARYNFQQREAIRRTWVNESANRSEFKLKSLFVVGDEDCDIPVEDRISPFGCERLILNTSLVSQPDLLLFRVTGATQSESCAPFAGVSFQVMDDVILKKVACVVIRGRTCLDIELLDVYGRTSIFKHNMSGSSGREGHLEFRDLHPFILLPKGFTGILVSRYKDTDTKCSRLCSTHSLDWDTSGLLRFLKSYRRSSDDSFSLPFDRSHLPLVSLQFQAAGADQRYRANEARNQQLRQKLQQEIQVHDDVLVVPVLESYRNLPNKLLHFFHWIHSSMSFKHAMKTDDDCFVDIERLQDSLIHQSLGGNSWWGNFRNRWAVDYYGKWTEEEYVSLTYPPFACGSGYIVSHSLVSFLSLNRQSLHAFQGEDVSLGIWLSPVLPHIRQDDRWLCSRTDYDRHQHDFISIPNLTPVQLENFWREHHMNHDNKRTLSTVE